MSAPESAIISKFVAKCKQEVDIGWNLVTEL